MNGASALIENSFVDNKFGLGGGAMTVLASTTISEESPGTVQQTSGRHSYPETCLSRRLSYMLSGGALRSSISAVTVVSNSPHCWQWPTQNGWAVDSGSTTTIDTSNNWWGAPDGPSGTGLAW
jgi:hypothetical protein